MRIAAAAYPLSPLNGIEELSTKAAKWVEGAAAKGADLVVFPEYGAMELAHIDHAAGEEENLQAAAKHHTAALNCWQELATTHGIHILTPSGPVFDRGSRPVNRCHLVSPEGVLGFQDKQMMTPYERQVDVVPGAPLRLFHTDLAKIGVLICYDSEFPLLARALVDAGADILLVPSCTETLAGQTRVRIAARARALENQCVVVHAPLVGRAPWCPIADLNCGRAAIFGPPDVGFPLNGVLSELGHDEPGLAIADVDLTALVRVRSRGQTRNQRDWSVSLTRLSVDLP